MHYFWMNPAELSRLLQLQHDCSGGPHRSGPFDRDQWKQGLVKIFGQETVDQLPAGEIQIFVWTGEMPRQRIRELPVVDENMEKLRRHLSWVKADPVEEVGGFRFHNIVVNARMHRFWGPIITYEDVVLLTGHENPQALHSVVFSKGRNGERGTLAPGQSVDVADGMSFSAFVTDNA